MRAIDVNARVLRWRNNHITMTSRTALLETIANRFLARREELAEEMTERIRADRLGGRVRNG